MKMTTIVPQDKKIIGCILYVINEYGVFPKLLRGRTAVSSKGRN